MRMHELRNSIRYFLMAGLFAMLFGSVSVQRAWAVRNTESSAVQDLLFQAREEAVGLDVDAGQTETLVRSDMDWQTHAAYLASVAEHVNRLSAIIEKLQTERENGSQSQLEAIDRVTPMLREIAANTTNAINYLNKNQTRPLVGEYATWLRENAVSAHELAQLISATVEYGQTKSKLESLAAQLQVNK